MCTGKSFCWCWKHLEMPLLYLGREVSGCMGKWGRWGRWNSCGSSVRTKCGVCPGCRRGSLNPLEICAAGTGSCCFPQAHYSRELRFCMGWKSSFLSSGWSVPKRGQRVLCAPSHLKLCWFINDLSAAASWFAFCLTLPGTFPLNAQASAISEENLYFFFHWG